MPGDVIPEDVQLFILQNIDSVAQLEGLLLMRSDASVSWDAHLITERLYIGEKDAATLLTELHERGFLTLDAGSASYSYRPGSAELERMVAKLADLYTDYLVPITHLVHSKSKSRIQKFADAFKIRKDPKQWQD